MSLVDRRRTTTYRDDGRVSGQTTRKFLSGAYKKESFVYFGTADSYFEPLQWSGYIDPFGVQQTITWGDAWTPGYDAAGVLRSYFVHVYNPTNEAVVYT